MLIVTRWLWREPTIAARTARLALLPLAALYSSVMTARAAAFRAGLRKRRTPALPTVAIGNLTVGGSGKTPLTQWFARRFVQRGLSPAIVLRGYGGDEAEEHRQGVPGAIVIETAERHAGIRSAAARGANVAVLDDAFQRLDVRPGLTVAAVSAESGRAIRWPLPAGPWREPWNALRRADLVIVTRKQASREAAEAVARRVRRVAPHVGVAQAALALAGFRPLGSHEPVPGGVVAGRRILAVAGIADPDSFAAQLEALGAAVTLHALPDHAPYSARQLAAVLQTARTGDYVVLTEKDAVKLRSRWPAGAQQPLVACLGIIWEAGTDVVERALERVVSDVARDPSSIADERG